MPRLNRQNAMTERHFHHQDDCAQTVTIGPRGGATYPRTEEWRRNGATQTWKREPDRFRIPVKYGLRGYGQLTDYDAPRWHTGTSQDCDLGVLGASIATVQGR